MTTTDPDQLRRDIERTQRGLSADVNALTEKVTPSRIVNRRVGRARRAVTSMKDRIMGTATETGTAVGEQVSSAASTVADTASSAATTVTGNVSSAASSAGEMVSDAPRALRRQTQGNPLAAGLIAFGLGALTASLLPPSRRERELAEQAKEHAAPMVGEMAGQLKDNLREPAEQAVESIRSTAQDAGSTVAEETQSAAADIKDRAQDATHRVKANSAGRQS